MKSLRNKVILSGIVLLFAFIATIGSTYAWFTVSTETSVTGINLQVTAADNLLIRVKDYDDDSAFVSDPHNPIYWSTSLTTTEIAAAGYLGTVEAPWRLQPATIIEPGYATYNAKTLSYLGSIADQDRTLTTIADPADKGINYNGFGGYYIKLEFYLYSQSDVSKAIELDPGVTTITASNAYAPLNNVQNATRLSVWMDDLTYGTQLEGDALVYGNDTDYSFVFSGEGELTSGTASTLTTPAYFNALSDIVTTGGNTLVTDLSTSVIDIQAGAMDTDLYMLEPLTPTLVTVLVYIEGWDAEATNDIVGALFSIGFGFMFGTEDL